MAFYPLEKLINLTDGYRKIFRITNHELLLIHESGEIHLLENFCPHRGKSLAKARVNSSTIVCPGHRYEFDLITGRCIKGQCSSLKIYPVSYEGDCVGIDL